MYDLIKILLSEGGNLPLPKVREITNDILKETVDPNHRLHHPFFYEILPLIKIAECIQGEGVVNVQFCSQYEEYDGEMIFKNGNTKKVEFTRELNKETGENEARRMRLLNERGHVPAFGKIKATYEKTETRRKKEVFEENQLITRQVKCEAWYQEISDSLVYAYQAKQLPKYKSYWLGITFNDWELPSLKDKYYFNIACNQFWKEVVATNAVFERVFVIGDSNNFIWDSRNAEK